VVVVNFAVFIYSRDPTSKEQGGFANNTCCSCDIDRPSRHARWGRVTERL